MGSLEDNQNLSETIRTEFDALLQSKDVTIQELQKKFAQANQQKEEFAAKAKTYSDENARLNVTIHELKSEYTSKINDMQTMLLDKDSLNKTLTDSCNDLKEKMEHMKQSADQAVNLQKFSAAHTFKIVMSIAIPTTASVKSGKDSIRRRIFNFTFPGFIDSPLL